MVIDTTGLKFYGAGEWIVRKHGLGRGRRRIWRKLHVGVDATTKAIVGVEITESRVHDSLHLGEVLGQVEHPIGQVSGDRAYDTRDCDEAILERDAAPTIPPRRNARVSGTKDPPPARAARDAVLRRIEEGGRYTWRTAVGATGQALAENAISQLKALVGVRLSARLIENQRVEAVVRCQALNRMAQLGLPISERVPVV